MVLRGRQVFNHWISMDDNQNTREFRGQLHPNHPFSSQKDRIKLVLLLSVLNGCQVSGHKVGTTDNPSTGECCAQVRTPHLFHPIYL